MASSSADHIRKRMSLIRQDMDQNVDGLVDSARSLTDWRSYVRAKPLLAAGLAAVVGYAIVPRRLQVMTPDPDTLAKLARDKRLVVEHEARAAANSGVAQSVFAMLGSLILRAGVSYVGQKAGKILGDSAAHREESESQR